MDYIHRSKNNSKIRHVPVDSWASQWIVELFLPIPAKKKYDNDYDLIKIT